METSPDGRVCLKRAAGWVEITDECKCCKFLPSSLKPRGQCKSNNVLLGNSLLPSPNHCSALEGWKCTSIEAREHFTRIDMKENMILTNKEAA